MVIASKTASVLFLQKNNMQTQSQSEFVLLQINTIYFSQNSIRYLGPIIWNSLPLTLRNVDSFSEFKFPIKNGKPTNCLCRLCKNYILILALKMSLIKVWVYMQKLWFWIDLIFYFCQILLLILGRFWASWLDYSLLEVNRRSLVFCWFFWGIEFFGWLAQIHKMLKTNFDD